MNKLYSDGYAPLCEIDRYMEMEPDDINDGINDHMKLACNVHLYLNDVTEALIWLRVGKIVLVHFDEDSSYYRALVEKYPNILFSYGDREKIETILQEIEEFILV